MRIRKSLIILSSLLVVSIYVAAVTSLNRRYNETSLETQIMGAQVDHMVRTQAFLALRIAYTARFLEAHCTELVLERYAWQDLVQASEVPTGH